MKIIFSLIFSSTFLLANSQIREINISDSTLFHAIDSVLIKTVNTIPPDLGVLLLRFEEFKNFNVNTEDNQIIFYAMYVSGVLGRTYIFENPPTYYLIIHNYPVLIYSGLEEYISFSESEINQLIKKIEFKLKAKDEGPPIFSPIWKVLVKKSRVIIEEQ